MIDRVADSLGRRLVEVPVGFKWFVPGLLDGSVAFGGEESAGASFLRRDGSVWTTDKDGILLALLASEILAVTGATPSERYRSLVGQFGDPAYARVDAPATREEKKVLASLSPEQVTATELAGEPITAKLTEAPGNGAAIGGLKVTTESAWFAARPSGTEDVYKIYAESFRGPEHLARGAGRRPARSCRRRSPAEATRMQLRVMTEPQEGATYDDLLAVAREAERLGFDAFFRSDHYQRIGPGDPGPGLDRRVGGAGRAGPRHVTDPARHDGVVGDLPAAGAAGHHGRHGRRDERRPGRARARQRLVRHRAPSYGIPFPPVGERFDLLEEQLAVVTGLWSTPAGETFSFAGTHYSLTDSPALPKPVQRPLPVVIGGKGKRRTPALAARFAAEYNVPFDTPEVVGGVLRPGPPGLRGGRPGPGVAGAVGGADAGGRRRRGRGTAAGRGRGRRPAGPGRRVSAAHRPRWSTRSAGSASSAPPGSTCR